MSAFNFFLCGVGLVTCILVLMAAIRWVYEAFDDSKHIGLQKQIRDLGNDLQEILESEGADSPATRWVIREMVEAALTRRWKGDNTLRRGLTEELERGAQ